MSTRKKSENTCLVASIVMIFNQNKKITMQNISWDPIKYIVKSTIADFLL